MTYKVLPMMAKKSQNAKIRVWSPQEIGWLTLIAWVVFGFLIVGAGPTFGISLGFALAAINWYRLGMRRKAVGNLFLGLGLAILAAIGWYFYIKEDVWLPTWASMGSLGLYFGFAFVLVAYLHKAMAQDLAQLDTEYEPTPRSVVAAGLVAALVFIPALLLQTGVGRAIQYLELPRIEATSTLAPGEGPAVTGTVHPWTDDPVAGRKIVLCELVPETTWMPYDCRLTAFVATTDEQGHFTMESVPPGRYLVFYDSGVADFEARLVRWQGRIVQLGNYAALSPDFFGRDVNNGFPIFFPEGAPWESLYYHYIHLTLMAGGAPFFVAHDIERAASYEFTRLPPPELPPKGVFIPTMVDVVEGYTSQVEFDVLYRGDVD